MLQLHHHHHHQHHHHRRHHHQHHHHHRDKLNSHIDGKASGNCNLRPLSWQSSVCSSPWVTPPLPLPSPPKKRKKTPPPFPSKTTSQQSRLWGNPDHFAYLASALHTQHPELQVLVTKRNAGRNTYDGIETCGERVAWEIEDALQESAARGVPVTRISVVGYSLGLYTCTRPRTPTRG